MKEILFCFFLCLGTLILSLPLHGQETTTTFQTVEEIDQEIKRLTDLKNRASSAAARHENEGMRWQFSQEYKQDAKRAFSQAEKERAIELKLQKQIHELEMRKLKILEKSS